MINEAQAVRDQFIYDPETGKLTRKKFPHRRCGSVGSHGYWALYFNGKICLVHRLIWLYMKGEWPTEIDHIDHNRLNNKWNNLREVSSSENGLNASTRRDNTSGHKGVSFYPPLHKWRASIGRAKKHLGYFDTKVEAIEAYTQAVSNLTPNVR